MRSDCCCAPGIKLLMECQDRVGFLSRCNSDCDLPLRSSRILMRSRLRHEQRLTSGIVGGWCTEMVEKRDRAKSLKQDLSDINQPRRSEYRRHEPKVGPEALIALGWPRHAVDARLSSMSADDVIDECSRHILFLSIDWCSAYHHQHPASTPK